MFSNSKTIEEDCTIYTVSHIALPKECRVHRLHYEVKLGGVCCLCFSVRLDYTSLTLSRVQTALVFIRCQVDLC